MIQTALVATAIAILFTYCTQLLVGFLAKITAGAQWRSLLSSPQFLWPRRPFLHFLRLGIAKAPFAATLISLAANYQLPYQIIALLLAALALLRAIGNHAWSLEQTLIKNWKHENGLSGQIQIHNNSTLKMFKILVLKLTKVSFMHDLRSGLFDLRSYAVLAGAIAFAKYSESWSHSKLLLVVVFLLSATGFYDALKEHQDLVRNETLRAAPRGMPLAFLRQNYLSSVGAFVCALVLISTLESSLQKGGQWIVGGALVLVAGAEILRALTGAAAARKPYLLHNRPRQELFLNPEKLKTARMHMDLGFTRARQAQSPVFRLMALRAVVDFGSLRSLLNLSDHLDLLVAAAALILYLF